jgi:hypothetical protein
VSSDYGTARVSEKTCIFNMHVDFAGLGSTIGMSSFGPPSVNQYMYGIYDMMWASVADFRERGASGRRQSKKRLSSNPLYR